MTADPGTAASCCSAGFYAVGRMIEKASSKPLPEFAQEVLFGPLGIGRIVFTTGNAFFVETPANAMMARVILPALLTDEATDVTP